MFKCCQGTGRIVALRRMVVALFGLATIAWPGVTLATLVLFFGIFAIADGVLALIALFDAAPTTRRWVLALHGVLSASSTGAAALPPSAHQALFKV